MRFVRILLLTSLLALIVVPVALALRFTDDSYVMPVGIIGTAYTKQFNGAGGCGPALPYQYSVIGGNLPPGLALSKSGLISGTPSSAGSWSFWVDLSDQNPPSASWCTPANSQRQFTIQVVSGPGSSPPLSIVQSALGSRATLLNQPYSFQFTAAGGSSQTWSVQSGTLPPGVALSSHGLLSGAPTVSGDYSFRIQVTDGTTTAAKTYALAVVAPLKIAATTVPAGEVGRMFRLQPIVTGGRPQYAWSVDAATPLPAGLALDPATGAISGLPTIGGSFPVKLAVADTFGFTGTVDLRLAVAPMLRITTRTVRSIRAGHSVRIRLLASGGVGARSWRITGGSLPGGLHLSSRAGVITGSPPRAASARIVVQVTDSLGAVARVHLRLRIRA